ncbi:ATP-binding protein [Streptomyces sp. NPDC056600]|uniref:ATP-binding protein n=1 Tax=Streptomyces sp. NPDC056600 TaxID=3345874 RepID=UPI0036BF8939
MLTYGVTDAGPRLRCVLPFDADAGEVRLLRKAVTSQLIDWGVPAETAVEAVEPAVAELAGNVIKHVGEGVSAVLIVEWWPGRLKIEVHDKGREVPVLLTTGCDDECGRGLHIVSALAEAWGTVPTAGGKVVWCEFTLPEGISCDRVERAARAVQGYCGADLLTPYPGRSEQFGLEKSVIELICDLLHWTAARGQDPDDFLDRVMAYYEAKAEAA